MKKKQSVNHQKIPNANNAGNDLKHLNVPLRESNTQIQQELVNSIVHGFGIIFGIVGIPILIAFAIKSDNTLGVIGAAIYGFCFLQLFTFSTLYHGFQHPGVKRVFEILDHISIYFLIAGTYTPFLLIYMNNAFGITLLSVLWGLTALGIVFKVFLPVNGILFQRLFT